MKILCSLLLVFLHFCGLCQLQKGQVAPDIQTVNSKIEEYRLYNDLKEKRVLLVFHRGFHSTHCNQFVKLLSDSINFFQNSKTKIVVVTPDNPKNIEKIIQKFNLNEEILFLYDYDCSIMENYKVAVKINSAKENFYKISGFANNKENFILPKTSCFLIDHQKIAFVYSSKKPKKRPSFKLLQEEILKLNS